MEVFVEVPDDEQQARRTLNSTKPQVNQCHDGRFEDLLRQCRHQDEEEQTHQLRACHEQVGRDATGQKQPKDAPNCRSSVEYRPQSRFGDPRVGQRSHFHRLQERLSEDLGCFLGVSSVPKREWGTFKSGLNSVAEKKNTWFQPLFFDHKPTSPTGENM